MMTTVTVVQPRSGGPYTNGPPLDGGTGPGVLAGNGSENRTTSMEVGVIIGVVTAIVFTLIDIFAWRARRNKRARNNLDSTAPGDGQSSERIAHPSPLPKDDRDVERFSTIEHDKILAFEPPPRAHPVMNWRTWNKHGQRDGGMSYNNYLLCSSNFLGIDD